MQIPGLGSLVAGSHGPIAHFAFILTSSGSALEISSLTTRKTNSYWFHPDLLRTKTCCQQPLTYLESVGGPGESGLGPGASTAVSALHPRNSSQPVVWALHESGKAPSDSVYCRGIDYFSARSSRTAPGTWPPAPSVSSPISKAAFPTVTTSGSRKAAPR